MILVDTIPLVALCDARDSKHSAAVRQLVSVAEEGLAVCDAVLTEACFHLPRESQRQRLRALLERLGVRAAPTEVRARFLEGGVRLARNVCRPRTGLG